ATGCQTLYRYDEYGRLIETQTPGGVTRYSYADARCQPLVAELPIEITDSAGRRCHLAYNEAGQLIAYTDCSGYTQRYLYNGWGHLIQITDPLGNGTYL
ncbi:MAG: hypothetical protein MI754_16295, partial [Chromatiales bacterium]|nr:hypothetical protein [Chromatiales bacterium]